MLQAVVKCVCEQVALIAPGWEADVEEAGHLLTGDPDPEYPAHYVQIGAKQPGRRASAALRPAAFLRPGQDAANQGA
jgi:hypothetical protein